MWRVEQELKFRENISENFAANSLISQEIQVNEEEGRADPLWRNVAYLPHYEQGNNPWP
jgi:hypothetical protein